MKHDEPRSYWNCDSWVDCLTAVIVFAALRLLLGAVLSGCK